MSAEKRDSVLECGVSTPLCSASEVQPSPESRWAYRLIGTTYRLAAEITPTLLTPAPSKELNKDFSDV
jgi:hypothetical protein